MTMPKEPREKSDYSTEDILFNQEKALVDVAVDIANDILSKKPRVRMRIGDKPLTREELVETATADFEKRLRETEIWDAMDKENWEARIDWFRKYALHFEYPKILSPAEEAAEVEEWQESGKDRGSLSKENDACFAAEAGF